jgi:hypothetical protein
MTTGQKQELFMRLLPRLIDKAHEMGFEIRGGDLFRDPRLHGQLGEKTVMHWLQSWAISAFKGAKAKGYSGYGHYKSAHKNKMAIDLNLFKDGVFLQNTEDHRELGEWWEQQHELARWGGRFNDGNHYSLEHNGVM